MSTNPVAAARKVVTGLAVGSAVAVLVAVAGGKTAELARRGVPLMALPTLSRPLCAAGALAVMPPPRDLHY